VKRQENTQQSAITQDGIATGTPAFMAPEMATGEGRIDGRTDLYALGCVGYWLLTGRLVFEGDTAIQVLLRHVRETPEPPSKRTEIVVPEDLDAIILRLLEKEPSRRFPDARALAAALAECERKIVPWTPERAASWWSVHVPEHRAAV
jgi:serine/threonine-protein kinase